MPRTDASSTRATAAPTDGGRTTRPCSTPGTRTLWTNSKRPATISGISTRRTEVPSTVQSAGASGFTVQYTRKVFEGPELVKDERYTVRYDAQNAIVEVGTMKVKAKPPKATPEKEPGERPAASAE